MWLMDVMLIDTKSLRIKGKNASFVLDPTSSIQKTEADGILTSKKSTDFSDSKVENSRITIVGPGEYEIGGIKVSAVKVDEGLVSRLDVDSVKVLMGEGSAVEKIHDKVEDCNIAIIRADSDFNHSILTSLDANVLIVYGDKSDDVKKSLGKDDTSKASKFSITSDKLPEEMQFVTLG
jgi:hypothetical protein